METLEKETEQMDLLMAGGKAAELSKGSHLEKGLFGMGQQSEYKLPLTSH